jgi:hypothetical protein
LYVLDVRVDGDFGSQALEAGQVVHPQAHGQAMFVVQLAGQAPANADVAIVIDDAAKQVECVHDRDSVKRLDDTRLRFMGNQEYQNFPAPLLSKTSQRLDLDLDSDLLSRPSPQGALLVNHNKEMS